jgi:hypothetical protein
MLTRREFLKFLTLLGFVSLSKPFEVFKTFENPTSGFSYNFEPRKKGKIFKFQPPIERVFHRKIYTIDKFPF